MQHQSIIGQCRALNPQSAEQWQFFALGIGGADRQPPCHNAGRLIARMRAKNAGALKHSQLGETFVLIGFENAQTRKANLSGLSGRR